MHTYLWRWDLALFHAIHPTMPPSQVMLMVARGFASGPLLLTAGLLGMMLLLPRWFMRPYVGRAILGAFVVLAVNGLIGLAWDRPRPFMAGVGLAWIVHAPTGSFPSDHLTLQWTVAGMLLLDRRTRWWGITIALLGLPMAWARIYLGVHYPSDMLGALGVAGMASFIGGWLKLGRHGACKPQRFLIASKSAYRHRLELAGPPQGIAENAVAGIAATAGIEPPSDDPDTIKLGR